MKRVVGQIRDVRGREVEDIYNSPRTAGAKRATWDLSDTWRYRQRDEVRFLSSSERRYLKDILARLERSDHDLNDGFPVRIMGRAYSSLDRIPRPLQGLAMRGLIEIVGSSTRTRGKLTARGVVAVRGWLMTKPPDFPVMFPKLYRAIDAERANVEPRVPR
jgi:hypothetical protein